MKTMTPAEQAHAEFMRNARRCTLAGGVRLDDLRALATTDEEPFELATAQQKLLWRVERMRRGLLVSRWMKVFAGSLVALACSEPSGRFLLLERDEPTGYSRICTYSDALGAQALMLRIDEACPPYLEGP